MAAALMRIHPVIASLLQNYPILYNPTSQIAFELPTQSMVSLDVFTLDGKHFIKLCDGSPKKGVHCARFNGWGPVSETYLYKLLIKNDIVHIRTMKLIK